MILLNNGASLQIGPRKLTTQARTSYRILKILPRFISVGKWKHSDAILKWKESAEFKNALSKISALLEEPTEPHIMKEVARVGELEIV